MKSLEEKILDKLDTLNDTTTTVKTKVESLEGQNQEQFGLLRENAKQITINTTEIGNLKNHRNGKNPLAKFLIKLFLGVP